MLVDAAGKMRPSLRRVGQGPREVGSGSCHHNMALLGRCPRAQRAARCTPPETRHLPLEMRPGEDRRAACSSGARP